MFISSYLRKIVHCVAKPLFFYKFNEMRNSPFFKEDKDIIN